MHVKPLLVEDQINVGVGQVIHSVPEVEVQAPAGHLAREGWEAPGGGIMAMQIQLSVESACTARQLFFAWTEKRPRVSEFFQDAHSLLHH